MRRMILSLLAGAVFVSGTCYGQSFTEYSDELLAVLKNAGEVKYVADFCHVDNSIDHYVLTTIDTVSISSDVKKNLLSTYRDSTKDATRHAGQIVSSCFFQRTRIRENVKKAEEQLIDVEEKGKKYGFVGKVDGVLKSLFH